MKSYPQLLCRRLGSGVLVLSALWVGADSARAAPLRLLAALEPGVATLGGSNFESSWGLAGGGSAAVGLSDLLWLELHLDHKIFPALEPALTATAWGVGLVYDIDIGPVRPFLELGLAGVAWEDGSARPPPPQVVPMLAAGARWQLLEWLWLGVALRYYAVFQSDLRAPAYGTVNLRLGVAYGG